MAESVGILGAGKLGIVLAQRLLAAGYAVNIANSREASTLAPIVSVLAPGAHALSAADVVARSDIIILALPLGKYRSIPREELRDKLVIDAMNFWWEVDGPREDILPEDVSTSEFIRGFLGVWHFVKALSHMGYHDLHDHHRPVGAAGRKAIAVAGDDPNDVERASAIVDAVGFDPLPIGELANGYALEPGRPGFGVNLNKKSLKALLATELY